MCRSKKDSGKILRIATILSMWAQENGVTTEELGVEFGCSQSTMSRFLLGSSVPDGPTVARIISWLFQYEDKE